MLDPTEPYPPFVVRRERGLLLLALLFVAAGTATLLMASPALGLARAIGLLLSFILSFAAAHATFSRCLPHRDPLLLPVAAFLSGWGLLMVARLAPNFLPRQATWLLLSTLAMIAVVQIGVREPVPLRWLRRYRYTWLFAGLLLLAATLVLGVNPGGAGPRLWLGIGGAYFQPSEPLKLLLVVFLASYLAERRELLKATGHRIGPLNLPPLAYVGPLLVMFGLTLLLLAAQQDLGAAMLLFFTFLAMLYLATSQWGYLIGGLALFLLVGMAGYYGSERVALRIQIWLFPWPAAPDQAFQIVQSLLAFGAGGIFGQGLGLGRPTYIPAVHTDFVFAAVAEEFGLLGTLALIALYGVLLLRGLRVALRAPRPFERFLAAGLTAGWGVQAWIIMAANVKLVPIAGVTLPFLSYGGSSLLATFIALGLLLVVSGGTTPAPRDREWVRPVRHLALGLSAALAILALACGYWSVLRAGWLVAREDNPRRVEYEQRIVRGQILDRNGVVLADATVSPDGWVTRVYPEPTAAPVVGYASLRHGTSGIEAEWDRVLRGEADRSAWETAWDALLHRPSHGQDVRLTLDVVLQRLAAQSLAGRTGAVVLLDASSGEVLAMASSPTFDPNRLEEEWEQLREDPGGPLLNRALQPYQPGAALETVVLAEALRRGLTTLYNPAPNLTATLFINGVTVTCRGEVSPEDWMIGALRAACPGPFAVLGEQLGPERLEEGFLRWGLMEAVPAERPPETRARPPEGMSPALPTPPPRVAGMSADAAREAIGQGDLTVSPLRMALVAATLANNGVMPVPRRVLEVQAPDGTWQTPEVPGRPREVLPPDAARVLLAAWESFSPDALGHLGTAMAGAGRPPHAWFLGVAPANAPRYAVAVLLEHASIPEDAARIGSLLLRAAQGR
ncbi:MAG: FtsW/RodA/SpoVE family cell cycle protein [Anaerolineae bacterium]|nr:FtsW/RodA/SpoVE family cell cycle protein [Anaerolineae bacterium]MDW8069185.1 FtsW/RodA/SpoVE family cell cycle protein [Anaerolineae bacterium]